MKKKSILFFTILMLFGIIQYSKAQGPILLVGIDTEDGDRDNGNISHGTIQTWTQIFQTGIFDNVSNGKSDILVIAGIRGGDVRRFWKDIESSTGKNVDFKYTPNSISNVDFSKYAMIAVATSDILNNNGLRQPELDALNQRANDVTDFICNGGGVFASSCGLNNPYNYISEVAPITTGQQNYQDITPTTEGALMGITNTNLDNGSVTNWHMLFLAVPDYLIPLATNTQNANVAAVGGVNAGVAEANLNLNKMEFCLNEPIIGYGQGSTGVKDHFWSIQESNANSELFGLEITQWFTGFPTIRNLTEFANSKGFEFKCNTYYRIKLAVNGLCTEWNETTKLIKINCPDANAGVDVCCSGNAQIGTNINNSNYSYSWSPQLGLANPINPITQVNCQDEPISDFDSYQFTLSVTDQFGCTNQDNVTVFKTKPYINILSTKEGCCGYKLTLQQSNVSTYLWSTGQENTPTIYVDQAGTYSVTATNPCGTTIKNIDVTHLNEFGEDFPKIIYPTAFTPNGDGNNDIFKLIHFADDAPLEGFGPAYNATEYNFYVFDGWGNILYQKHGETCTGFLNGEIGWDGTNNVGVLQPQGVYNWKLELLNCRITQPKYLTFVTAETSFKCVDCRFGIASNCGFLRTCYKYVVDEITYTETVGQEGAVTLIR